MTDQSSRWTAGAAETVSVWERPLKPQHCIWVSSCRACGVEIPQTLLGIADEAIDETSRPIDRATPALPRRCLAEVGRSLTWLGADAGAIGR